MIDAATYEKVFRLFKASENIGDNFKVKYCVEYDGYYYATDAHSMIFMPVEKAKLDFEKMEVGWHSVIPTEKNCNTVIKVSDIDRQLIPEMIDEYIEKEIESKCRDCDGEGELECDLGHTHDCNTCDGKGTIVQTIKTASGKKIAYDMKAFVLNGVVYSYKQLRRLIDACKLLEVETITQTFKILNLGNLFECGNVSVLVMFIRSNSQPTNLPEIKI